jgi:hypothetical protein
MKTLSTVIVVAMIGWSGVALASSCPSHMRKIDEALAKNPSLSAAQMAEVKTLRAQGEELHKSGKHAESEAALGKAETILGIKH